MTRMHFNLAAASTACCLPAQAVVRELSDPLVGAENIEATPAGVTFTAPSLAAGYRACLWLRSGVRVLVKLGEQQLDGRRAAGDTVGPAAALVAPQ